MPYIYHKKSREEEKLEMIETAVTDLKRNIADTGTQLMAVPVGHVGECVA